MELVLNAFWLLLVLAGVCLPAQGGDRKLGRWQMALALTCAALLLFPAISMSDDLHPMQAAIEDASKRTAKGAPSGHTVQPSSAAALPAAALLAAPVFRATQQVTNVVRSKPRSRTVLPEAGRAPPAVLA